MKNIHWIVAAIVGFAGTAAGQAIDFGGQSEAERFLNNFRRQASASTVKQEIIRRSTQAATGFGSRTVRPTTVDNLIGGSSPTPQRRQSASFGINTASPAAKPFSTVRSRPTVSPYMNIFNEGITENGDLNYQTQVRPRLQQQQFNEQVVQQAQAINRRLTALSARSAYNITGNQNVMPTGHAATFQNYSRFYPSQGQRRR